MHSGVNGKRLKVKLKISQAKSRQRGRVFEADSIFRGCSYPRFANFSEFANSARLAALILDGTASQTSMLLQNK